MIGEAQIVTDEDTDLLAGGLLLGSEWMHQTDAGTMAHVNPATGQVQAHFPVAGPAEVDRAVAAARMALSQWRYWTPADRQLVLRRLAELLRANSERLGRVTALENGTPISIAATYGSAAAEWFDYYAGWVDKITGDVSPGSTALNFTRVEPVGVVAIVLTWNGPIGSIGMKVAAALAAGCTVVLKPPELAPFSSSLFGRLVLEAGIPPGVLNVVPGGSEAGQRLVEHPDLDKISFTGSPATAARIQAACAQSLTPLLLELGGKSANIVLDDADLEIVGQSAALGVAALSGQVCVAPTRLIVQDKIYDEMIDRVAAVLSALPMGDPMDPGTFIGPLINATAQKRVIEAIEVARSTGNGRYVTGGERGSGDLASGSYLTPALFADVQNSSPLAQEELFGPVLSVLRVQNAEEAAAVANDSRFGLAAYVHTRDIDRALRLADLLDAGNISINGGKAIAGPVAPFGGFKDSGYGKEGGLQGMLEYVRIKNVNIALAS